MSRLIYYLIILPAFLVPHIAQAQTSSAKLGDATALSGEWQGEYKCGKGNTGLTLTLEGTSKGLVAGTSFYPLPDNPGVRSGSYSMRSTFGGDGHLVLLGTN